MHTVLKVHLQYLHRCSVFCYAGFFSHQSRSENEYGTQSRRRGRGIRSGNYGYRAYIDIAEVLDTVHQLILSFAQLLVALQLVHPGGIQNIIG